MPDYTTETADNAESQNAMMPTAIDKDAGRAIKAALAKIARKQPAINEFNRYYEGKHPFNFSSEKFRTAFAERLQKFRDNLCPAVVKAPADRLEITGFASQKETDVYNASWEIWKYSQMPRIAKRVHRDAFKTGDAFVIVWTDDDGKARIYHQDPRTCTVFYNGETGNVESAAKLWRGNDNYVYLTLYYTDRIEKYVTRNPQAAGNVPTTSAAFKQRIVPGESWPLPNDAGVCPMFHFGLESSILTDVIPLNDALNKTIADLLVSSETNSLRQRWVSGIAFEVDPETGKQIIPFENASQWFAADDESTKFGEFTNGNLKEFMEVANDFRNEIATVAGIPHYYLRLDGGSMPSGESLRKAESRFTSIIKDAQGDFGETWAAVMRFALQLEGLAADAADDKKQTIETQWSPADPMSSNEAVDLAIKKKNVGVSETRNLQELGYSDADIKTMQKENQEKAAAAADNFGRVFDAGATQ